MVAAYPLSPSENVDISDGRFVATAPEPWLDAPAESLEGLRGRYVEIRYRFSFYDVPVRPVFRFETASGAASEFFAPGPVAGLGIWVGRVPADARRFRISPTNRPGRFDFEIDSIRRRFWPVLVIQAFRHAPRPALSAVLTRLIGWRRESDHNLSWALGTTPPSSYASWRAARSRPFEARGIDAPRCDWARAPRVDIWVDAAPRPAFEATLASLRAQIYPHWQLHVRGTMASDRPSDPRVGSDAGVSGGADDLRIALSPGDLLLPHALACVIEAAQRHPDAKLFYGDEEEEDAAGRVTPVFKPGWSPRLNRQRPFLGRCVFRRAASLTPDTAGESTDAIPEAWTGQEVVALRRVLMRRGKADPPSRAAIAPPRPSAKRVSIIIPTKDHAARLARLVRSIERHRPAIEMELVIIDNRSRQKEARAYLSKLRQQKNISVIDDPRPFDFSAMANAGAAQAKGDVLVFLNNDMEILDDPKDDQWAASWLDRLAAWAMDPRVGAVGARLSFPAGPIQHIGVVLGMGGSAGHFGAGMPPGAPGWSHRHEIVHEIGAVTGACLAIERRKFMDVGGFDAVHLPIELSDVDLCLRLAAKGWTSLVDPHVHLMHEESASRGGATFRRLQVYEEQRAYFVSTWRAVLRDDPYFHPGLSLFDRREALG